MTVPDKILVIDDDIGISAALLARLRACGYEAVHADRGERGLVLADEDRPDLIILDIRMPDIDGYEVCRRLKASSDLKHIPVLFLSANVQDSAQRKAIDTGGQAFLSKPYDATELVRKIQKLLSQRSGAAPALLIVDDDERLTEALRVRFEALGYACTTANSGTSGLAAFREQSIDLVITDLNMPGASGTWFAKLLRERSDVPIIIMTGYASDHREELEELTNTVVLEKPVDIKRLLELVESKLAQGAGSN